MSYRVAIIVKNGQEEKKTVIGVGTTQEKAIENATKNMRERLTAEGKADLVGAVIVVELSEQRGWEE